MKRSGLARAAVPFLFLACGAAMIIFGAAGGAAEDIWRKAVRICMECIGIG